MPVRNELREETMNQADVEQSLVNILRGAENCGMGVFGPNRRVVTARHCVNDALGTVDKTVWVSKFMDPSVAVDMAVEWYDENFEIDIAILKPLSDEAFQEFEKHLRPAPVQLSMPNLGQPFNVHLFRRDDGWETGMSKLIAEAQQMVMILSYPVMSVYKGTSGTGAFDDAGALIGVAMLSDADSEPEESKRRPPVFASLGQLPPEAQRLLAQ
jgi:hypothetical protein